MPAKLAALDQHLDSRLLSKQTPDPLQTLVAGLLAIAYRIKELVDTRRLPQPSPLVMATPDGVQVWRLTAERQLRRWADDPALAAAQGAEIRDRLLARMSRLEEQIRHALQGTKKDQVNEEKPDNVYRMLGAFRGLSESGVEYLGIAGRIDRTYWQKARF